MDILITQREKKRREMALQSEALEKQTHPRMETVKNDIIERPELTIYERRQKHHHFGTEVATEPKKEPSILIETDPIKGLTHLKICSDGRGSRKTCSLPRRQDSDSSKQASSVIVIDSPLSSKSSTKSSKLHRRPSKSRSYVAVSTEDIAAADSSLLPGAYTGESHTRRYHSPSHVLRPLSENTVREDTPKPSSVIHTSCVTVIPSSKTSSDDRRTSGVSHSSSRRRHTVVDLSPDLIYDLRGTSVRHHSKTTGHQSTVRIDDSTLVSSSIYETSSPKDSFFHGFQDQQQQQQQQHHHHRRRRHQSHFTETSLLTPRRSECEESVRTPHQSGAKSATPGDPPTWKQDSKRQDRRTQRQVRSDGHLKKTKKRSRTSGHRTHCERPRKPPLHQQSKQSPKSQRSTRVENFKVKAIVPPGEVDTQRVFRYDGELCYPVGGDKKTESIESKISAKLDQILLHPQMNAVSVSAAAVVSDAVDSHSSASTAVFSPKKSKSRPSCQRPSSARRADSNGKSYRMARTPAAAAAATTTATATASAAAAASSDADAKNDEKISLQKPLDEVDSTSSVSSGLITPKSQRKKKVDDRRSDQCNRHHHQQTSGPVSLWAVVDGIGVRIDAQSLAQHYSRLPTAAGMTRSGGFLSSPTLVGGTTLGGYNNHNHNTTHSSSGSSKGMSNNGLNWNNQPMYVQNQSVYENEIILDYDDTILPSTFLRRQGFDNTVTFVPRSISDKLRPVEDAAIRLIQECIEMATTDRVFIVTSAQSGWVEATCKLYMPRLARILRSLRIISARSCFGRPFTPVSHWKFWAMYGISAAIFKVRMYYPSEDELYQFVKVYPICKRICFDDGTNTGLRVEAFKQNFHSGTLSHSSDTSSGTLKSSSTKSEKYPPSSASLGAAYHAQYNLLQIGDSNHERKALMPFSVLLPTDSCTVKSVSLRHDPSLEVMTMQLNLLTKNLSRILDYPGHLDLYIMDKYTVGTP